MIIHILDKPATEEQLVAMLDAHRFYIKTVVDIYQGILAGGGEMHSDCEIVLLDIGSNQENLWGASWNPATQEILYESMVNLRPRQNRSMQILDISVRHRVKEIIDRLLGGL